MEQQSDKGGQQQGQVTQDQAREKSDGGQAKNQQTGQEGSGEKSGNAEDEWSTFNGMKKRSS